MLSHTEKGLSFDIGCCCICGLTNCLQATDHERILIDQLKDLLQESKNDSPEIDQMKFSVKKKFYKLRKQLSELIHQKENLMIKWLDSFYFKHLENRTTMNSVKILCDVFENDFRQLPNKNVNKIVKTLSRGKNKIRNESFEFLNTVKQDIEDVLSSIEISKILQQVNKNLKTQRLSSFEKPQNKLSRSADSVKTWHSNTSTRTQTIIKPIDTEIPIPFTSYEWKHIRITPITKTLQLNNRHITDHDMIQQVPIISTFSNIRQLQIRNNKITTLSCSLIANQMNFLTMVDLRGNRVGDDGMKRIIINMSKLKGLYISETGVSDKTGELIVDNLPQLETLWAEHNRMTGQSCIKISQKSKLRLLSLIGNSINEFHKVQIQTIFRSKGYINI